MRPVWATEWVQDQPELQNSLKKIKNFKESVARYGSAHHVVPPTREIKAYACIQLLTTAFFIIVKKWKQAKDSSANRLINKI